MPLEGLVAKAITVNGKRTAWITREEDDRVHVVASADLQPVITELVTKTAVSIELWRNRRHPVFYKEIFTNFGKVTGFNAEGETLVTGLGKPLDLTSMRVSEVYFTYPIADKAIVAAVIAKYS